MMASRSGRTAKPAAQPVANPWREGEHGRAELLSSAEQHVPAAGTRIRDRHTRRFRVRHGAGKLDRKRAYSADGGSNPKKGKGKIIGLVVGLVILAIVAFGGTTGFFLYKDAKNLQAQAGTLISKSNP